MRSSPSIFRDLNNQLGHVAGVRKPGTHCDDVKTGSADDEAGDVVMPSEWHFERKRDVEVTVAFDPESEGLMIGAGFTEIMRVMMSRWTALMVRPLTW